MATSLAVGVADHPIEEHGGGQPQAGLGLAGLVQPRQRRPHVVQLGVQAGRHPVELRREQPRDRRFDHRQDVGGVRVLAPSLLAARRQPLQPELADRFQHPVARLFRLRATDGLHDALLDQRRDAVERVEPAVAHAGDRFGPRKVETASEDGQAAEEPLLSRVEQVVTPGDRVAHRPQAVRPVAGPPGQQRQGSLQPRQQRRRRQDGDAGRGQLDRQRQPVQPGADCRHRRLVGRGQGEVGTGRPGAGDEELDGLRHRQGMDGDIVLVRYPEHRPGWWRGPSVAGSG